MQNDNGVAFLRFVGGVLSVFGNIKELIKHRQVRDVVDLLHALQVDVLQEALVQVQVLAVTLLVSEVDNV